MKHRLAMATGFLALVASGGSAVAGGPSSGVARRADVTFRDVRIWSFKGSVLSGVGSAASLAYDRSAGRGVAESALATVPGRGRDPRPVHLSAGAAEGRVGARVVSAHGGVVLSRADGTVRTASARFDGTTHTVAGTEAVALESGATRVDGSAFSLDTLSERIELLGPVKAHGQVAP